MRRTIFVRQSLKLVLVVAAMFLALNVTAQKKEAKVITDNAQFSTRQLLRMVDSLPDKTPYPSPRNAKNNKIGYTGLGDWTSGFFPGSLWYAYELTKNKEVGAAAKKYTEEMEHIKYYKGNHDIGFMIFCSFGNGLRLSKEESYKDVITTAAKTLTLRYHPTAGIIQSWNGSKKWDCPVIIDNMMNLELLFEATLLSGDSTYWNIAVSHANQTMKNHFRPDNSSFHVVGYNKENGEVINRTTHQGYSDESAWARGQAWGLYGYTMCYRYTKNPIYLEQAEKIAAFIFNHPNLPADLIPYWDFNAPNIPDAPRDASAASITSAALYELSTYTKGKSSKNYKKLADTIVDNLSTPAYRANEGENGNFVLMHSTGHLPGNSEIDVALCYADYYFLESLKRKRDLEAN